MAGVIRLCHKGGIAGVSRSPGGVLLRRRSLEVVVHWLYKHDAALRLPYQDNLGALIHEPTFRNAVGPAVFAKVKVIKDLGNLAVHSHKNHSRI